MAFKIALSIAIPILALSFGILEDVNAASISIKCETRGISRSKVSVDGGGLTGTFYAIVYSPPGTAVKSKYFKKSDVNHDVEFDFDSNPSDVADGATKILPTFIKNRTVYGYIRRSGDNVLMGALKATCVAK